MKAKIRKLVTFVEETRAKWIATSSRRRAAPRRSR